MITNSGEILTDHSVVRGTKVLFDEATINEHYNLRYKGNDFDDKYDNHGKKKMEQIKERVAKPRSPWEEISHNEFKLKIKYIIPELSNWNMFINGSIMPTSYNYSLPNDKLIILDCILNDENINIGRIINKEIRDCAKKIDGYIFFPCFITALCITQKVEISMDEMDERNQRKNPPIELSAKMKARRVLKAPELEEKKEVDEEEKQKENAVRRFVLDQHEWFKKRLEEISQAPSNLEILEFLLWVFEDVDTTKETDKEGSEEEEKVEKKKKLLKRMKETIRKGGG